MKQKIIVLGILMLLIASTALVASGITLNQKNYEIQSFNQLVEPSLSYDIEMISVTNPEITSSEDTFFVHEGQFLGLWITGYYSPPNPTRPICLWAENTTIPAGAVLIPECNCGYGNVTSVFQWIPSNGQAGTYIVRFYMGETCYNPCRSFNITIIVYPSGADDPPIVIINSPLDETTVNDPGITVIGYATDDQELISFGRIHEWTDDQVESSSTFPPPGPTNYPFEETFTLYEGWNRITIYVSDSDGQNAQDEIVVYYEIQPNQPPSKPATPVGPTTGKTGMNYQYVSYVSDPDGDAMEVLFDWGDGTNSSWIGPIASGSIVEEYHTYTSQGTFSVKLKARDIPEYNESVWSDSLEVSMPKSKLPHLSFLEKRFPFLFNLFFS